ncbi:MAG: V4R domain-containing protein [Gemmatimonadota bacterium]
MNPDPLVVQLPVSALTTLSRRCSTLGDAGVRALREAGYRAGIELFPQLDEAPEQLPPSTFWLAVDGEMRRLGLGSVSFLPVTRELATVAWRGSPEARGPRSDPGIPCCHFASGLLAGLLSRAAGQTVAVVEARCRSMGSEPCWFMVGSPDRVRALPAKRGAQRALHEVLAPEP